MSFRILLLSADFGSGHLAAARAIATLCQELNPGCQSEPVQVRSSLWLNLVSWGYLKLIVWTPWLYRWLYSLPVGAGVRSLPRLLLGRAVQREISRTAPAVIVGTHPFPAGVAAKLRRKGRIAAPVVMALTDFLPHGFWVHEGVDLYCVSSESAAARLVRLGVEERRIAVTGVAIRPEFQPEHPASANGTQPVRRVLVMGGGLGLGPIAESVRSLAALPHPSLIITVICGTNRALERELRGRFRADPRIEIIGFTPAVADYMKASALLVTKPGGITCSEAMAVGLPMLLLDPLPGHEEENAQYLVEAGAAAVTDQHSVGARAADLLFARPRELDRMRERALANGHPRSAEAIASEILSLSEACPANNNLLALTTSP